MRKIASMLIITALVMFLFSSVNVLAQASPSPCPLSGHVSTNPQSFADGFIVDVYHPDIADPIASQKVQDGDFLVDVGHKIVCREGVTSFTFKLRGCSESACTQTAVFRTNPPTFVQFDLRNVVITQPACLTPEEQGYIKPESCPKTQTTACPEPTTCPSCESKGYIKPESCPVVPSPTADIGPYVVALFMVIVGYLIKTYQPAKDGIRLTHYIDSKGKKRVKIEKKIAYTTSIGTIAYKWKVISNVYV